MCLRFDVFSLKLTRIMRKSVKPRKKIKERLDVTQKLQWEVEDKVNFVIS